MEAVNGITKASPKATRKRLTFAQKLDALNRLEKGEKPQALARSLGCSSRAISRLKQQRNFFERLPLEPSDCTRKSWHSSRNAALEEALTNFLEIVKRTGFPVFSTFVRRAALKIRDELLEGDENVAERVALEGFQASANWAKAFAKRRGLREGQGREAEGVGGCDTEARNLLKDRLGGYDVECVMWVESFNIFYKVLPGDMRSWSVSEDEGSSRNDLKDRVVVIVGCNAAGSFKLPATMVWKDDKPGCFTERGSAIPHLYHAYALLDEDVLKTWFVSVGLPAIKRHTSKRVALVVPDDWPALSAGEVDIIRSSVCKPGGGPLHGVGCRLRQCFREGVAGGLQASRGGARGVYAGLSRTCGLANGEKACLLDVGDLVQAGWQGLTAEFLRGCWVDAAVLGAAKEEMLRALGVAHADAGDGMDGMDGWLGECGIGRKEFVKWVRVEDCARGVRGMCYELDGIIRTGILKRVVGRVCSGQEGVVVAEKGCEMPCLAYLMDLVHPLESVITHSGRRKAALLVRQLRNELLLHSERE